MSNAHRVLRLAYLAATMGAACAVPIEARAAVALCERSHSGEIAEDKSELTAKKRALESWVAHASRLGEAYTRWGIAWNRQLECTRTDAGLFRCTAVGQPCAIRHVPPAGGTPLRRRDSN
jgi:hypothetical protein